MATASCHVRPSCTHTPPPQPWPSSSSPQTHGLDFLSLLLLLFVFHSLRDCLRVVRLISALFFFASFPSLRRRRRRLRRDSVWTCWICTVPPTLLLSEERKRRLVSRMLKPQGDRAEGRYDGRQRSIRVCTSSSPRKRWNRWTGWAWTCPTVSYWNPSSHQVRSIRSLRK